MMVSVETTAGLERRMTIQVPAEQIESEIDSRLRRYGKTAKIKGFRPGKVPMQVVRQRYQGLIGAETQVHFGVVHLHNQGRLMSLRDVTTDELLWQVEARYELDREQIADLPAYASDEGFTLYPDHVYELAAVYDNKGEAPADAMATMYLYHEPAESRTLTYPPAPDAVPPGDDGQAMAEGDH